MGLFTVIRRIILGLLAAPVSIIFLYASISPTLAWYHGSVANTPSAPISLLGPEIAGLDYPNNGVTATATGTVLTLTANPGQWQNPLSFSYNWHFVGGSSLGNGSTLTLNTSTSGVLGSALEVDVTASNLSGSTTVTSHWFGPIEASAPAAPNPTTGLCSGSAYCIPAMEKSLPPTGSQPLPAEPSNFLQCYGPGAFQHAIFPGGVIPPCAPNTASSHVWYFDPIHGTTKDAGATGHAGSPFKDVAAIFNGVAGYTGGALFGLGKTIVPGDTIYLEPGDVNHPVGDLASGSPIYSTSDGTTSGTVLFTWILPDPAAASIPVLHLVKFQNGSAGFLVRGINVEQYRENNNHPVSVGGGDSHDMVFEDMSISQWIGHSTDPWLPSNYPNSGGSSDGTVVTAAPTFSYGVEDPTTTVATAAANSSQITMTKAPSASLLGFYIWSPGYYVPAPVVTPGASGIPNGSKVTAINGNVVTIAPCDPVADHATGCPSTPYPGLSTGIIPGCDPETTSKNNTQTLSTFGGCPAGPVPAWNGTTRALNAETVSYTAALTILPDDYWNHNDFEGAGASGFKVQGAVDVNNSVDPTHPNLIINAQYISIKDCIVRDGFNGYAMLEVYDTILYNNRVKFMSGDGFDGYTVNRVWWIHNYYSDPTVLWAHQDGLQWGTANGRGENAATTDTFYSNAAIENEFYVQTDPTNYFPRGMQGIGNTEHTLDFTYACCNIIDVVNSGGGISAAGHYDVVAQNTVTGLVTIVEHQKKGSDTSSVYSMLANNVGNGESRDNAIPNYCDPVTGDLDTVEGNVALPFVPLGIGSSSVFCTTANVAGVGTAPGVYQGLSVWTQTDWRSNQAGISSLFTAYQPLGSPVEPQPGWITPPFRNVITPCVQNSFPSIGGCGPTVAGSNNMRPNSGFSGTTGTIALNVQFPQNLPNGHPDGTLAVVSASVGSASNGVWSACAACSLRTNGVTIHWQFVSANYNPGIIGAGINLGAQQPIADHDGNAWNSPPSAGAYE